MPRSILEWCHLGDAWEVVVVEDQNVGILRESEVNSSSQSRLHEEHSVAVLVSLLLDLLGVGLRLDLVVGDLALVGGHDLRNLSQSCRVVLGDEEKHWRLVFVLPERFDEDLECCYLR